jgi:hypothetical protein
VLLRALAVVAILAASPVGFAHGSAPLSDKSITAVTLQVDAKGEALVSYVRSDGQPRHVLAWGAINALPPMPDVPQVAFKWDYSGGWRSHHNGKYWQTFANACRTYDGPPLVDLVAACKAPNGSYWAVQAWQRNLPHRGFPATAAQTAYSFDLSHWSGPLGDLELSVDWPKVYNHETEQIFGQLSYDGAPVHGFHTTANGIPTDGYGRGLYIDTFDSAYGSGWQRETSIVFRNPTGAFCYAFYPTHDVTLPGAPARPAGNGTQYRITTIGPGVTPDLQAQVDGIGAYDAGSQADVSLEQSRLALYAQLTAGDAFCATQR